MRALLSTAPGAPETLAIDEIATPAPGKGELRVRVLACALNFPDTLVIEDKYQFRPQRPFAPGSELCGEVEAIGEGVEGWSVGDRLIATVMFGGLAEQAIVIARQAFKVAPDSDPLEGAGLLFTYGTTIHALADRGQLREGETLLVLGAAGGIGLSGVEIGKAVGARVVAAVSSEAKATAAREAGADETLVYGRAPFDKDASKGLAAAFKDAVGADGAHVIYDPVGGDYAEPALRAIAWEGRYLVVGFPAGIPKLPLNLTLLKGCDVRGVFWGAFVARHPERHRAHVEQLLGWWRAGRIRPRIDRVFTLDEAGPAIARLAAREAIGKIVVRID